MTIKDLAYRAQQRLSVATTGSFKRSHVYELLAAAFERDSYAAFCSDSVFAQLPPSAPPPASDAAALKRRCHELGYVSSADAITAGLIEELQAARLAAVRIHDVVDALRSSAEESWDWGVGDDESEAEEPARPSVRDLVDFESRQLAPFLLESLEAAAGRSNALAHYALALLYRDDDEDHFWKPQGSAYWHEQRLLGEELSPAATEWADEYERQKERARRADLHLREAARLGDRHALLDLADFQGDPTFFDASPDESIDEDPARIAEIADRLGRGADAHHWLTIAAEEGDVESIQALIESYDKNDLERCWAWIYLAQRLGTDLTKHDMRAYHDGGPQADEEYDDDYGGAAYVVGRDAIKLQPLEGEADRVARQRADALFRKHQEIEGGPAESADSA
jgi:hypothetical protein